MSSTRRLLLVVLAFGPALPALASAQAAEPRMPSRALAARGPLALSFAAEPASSRWALESGVPLFGGNARGAQGNDPARRGGLGLNALVIASAERGAARAMTDALAYTLTLDHRSGAVARWMGISFRDPEAGTGPRTRLRLAAGTAGVLSGVQAEASLISSSVVFRNDPRWMRTRSWRFQPYPESTDVWRDTSTTYPGDHQAAWTTAQGSLRWQRGRWAVETIAGLTIGEYAGPARWAQAVVRMQWSRRALVLASLGERPAASLAFDGSGQPRTMLGVQIAPWSTREWEMSGALHPRVTRWKTEPAGPGRAVLRVHAREARRVEIAGDFTDWRPLALLRLNGGWWGVMVQADPGPHRVQIRLDGGAWFAPPGLPRAEPGPAGEAATLIVP